MKKILLVFCLTLVLTSCDSVSENTDTTQSILDTEVVTTIAESSFVKRVNSEAVLTTLTTNPFFEEETKHQVKNILPESEINTLNNTKCGYGQGLNLDEKNRPYGALDFNTEYSKYDAYAIMENQEGICLTFDQGYENGYTGKILDTLKEKNVKAVFFLLADYAEKNPELVERMVNEGHVLGNHSVHHYSMPTLDNDTARKEIMDVHNYIKDKYNYEMYLFRPPMGEFSEKSVAITQTCGYKTIEWSYAYFDWDVTKQMDPKKALEKLTDATHNGAIYLLHSVSETNSEILGDFIDNARAKGFEFTVPQ